MLVKAINASIEGGHSIMDVYSSDFRVEHKDDKSPLTLADKKCNTVIENHLIRTGIPLLSEEGDKISFKEMIALKPIDIYNKSKYKPKK